MRSRQLYLNPMRRTITFSRFIDLLLFSNLFISIGAALLIYETYWLLGIKPDMLYPAIGFFSTLFIYNLDRLIVLKSIKGIDSARHKWIVKYSALLIGLSVLALLFLLVSIFFLPLRIIIFLAHLGIISSAYSVPFFIKGLTLRSIKGLKIFLIVYVWAASTVIMPAAAAGLSIFQKDVILFFAERALFIFIITLPFDIRDFRSDKSSNVLTIPGYIGIKATKRLIIASTFAFILINLFHYPLSNGIFWAKLISITSSAWIAWKAREDHHEYYFTGLLDGTMILQFLLIWVFIA
jgi:hypothetical protein